MKINRKEFLDSLKFAKIGTPSRGETLEQSNAFVFVGESLITFNDEIKTESPSPLPEITVAVLADELLRLVEKLPDDELDVSIKNDQFVLKGKSKQAGITCFAEILLPFDTVPTPTKFKKIGEETATMLQQAARTCGSDVTQELTTVVHVTDSMVEACDNYRLFRATIKTGFLEEVLLPASNVLKLGGLDIKAVMVEEGWCHFRLDGKRTISVRTVCGEYHKGLDRLLQMKESFEIQFPKSLPEIVSRAQVMLGDGEDGNVRIKLSEGQLEIESRKECGWYKEREKIDWNGDPIGFDIHPKFLAEIMSRKTQVLLSPKEKRLKIETENIQFMVSILESE